MLRFIAGEPRGHGWTRREFLRVGGLAGLGIGARMGRLHAASGSLGPGFGRARSVILIYANGGQSQLELWDPKPDAPAEVRGEFRAIPTAIPGVHFGEHLPRLAALADRYTIVRSVSHDDLDHGSATYLALTGRFHPQKSANPPPSLNDFPTYGSLLKRVRPSTAAFETAIHVNAPALAPIEPAPGQNGGFLGRALEPMLVGDVTSTERPTLDLPHDLPLIRVAARQSLLSAIDQARAATLDQPPQSAMDIQRRRALELIGSPACRRAFDLEAEPPKLRDRYGRNRSGQACLLARRLVEAGVPWITVMWNHSGRGQDQFPGQIDQCGWDTHNDIFETLRTQLLPRFDLSLSALLEDLEARGLLDQTLVICMGEFGRAPRVALEAKFTGSSPGRKHWANVYSILMAGAGVRPGAVFGRSDRNAAYPEADRVGPWDIAATAFAALGVDPATEYRDQLDRPFTLVTGRPITGLYG